MCSGFFVLANYGKVLSALSVNKWQQKGETTVFAGYFKLRIHYLLLQLGGNSLLHYYL